MYNMMSALQELELEQQQQESTTYSRMYLVTSAPTASDSPALKERLVRVLGTAKRERQARLAAEERAMLAESELARQALRIDEFEREMHACESESGYRRQRVEQMVALLDSLQLSEGN